MLLKETYPIIGMHCASCKALIEKAVNSLEGVKSVKINYGSEKLILEYDNTKVALDKIKKEMSKLGTYELITDATGKNVLSSPRATKDIVKEKKKELAPKMVIKKRLTKSRLSDLSLVVDTGGAYREEFEEIKQ